MKFAALLAAGAMLAPGFAPAPAGNHVLRGDYLEARTCDVWVGACYANSETGEAGKQATIAWKFSEGKWRGVDLAGIAAVILIDAKRTLGDPYHSPLPARSVLLLDERASDDQLIALREFVKAQVGELAADVVEERLLPITLETECCDEEGCSKLVAGDLVKIETRCIHSNDGVCGHEETYYPPLTSLAEKRAAYTVEHEVKKTLLGCEWDDRDTRSSFIGKFEALSPPARKRVDPAEIAVR